MSYMSSGPSYGKVMGSDNVRVMGMVYYGLYTWDFFADVFFSVRLWEQWIWHLAAPCTLFVIVPYVMNMVQLHQNQKKWMNDLRIAERIRGWLIDWNFVLSILAATSGSAYAAIEIANRCVFPTQSCFVSSCVDTATYLVTTSSQWVSPRATSSVSTQNAFGQALSSRTSLNSPFK